jgi:hypothetical protein
VFLGRNQGDPLTLPRWPHGCSRTSSSSYAFPGTAKTVLARAIAQSIKGGTVGRIQFLGQGPLVDVGHPKRLELAPYAAVAALLPIAVALRRRDP